MSDGYPIVADHKTERPARSDYNDDIPRPRNRGIKQISCKKHWRCGIHWHNYDGIFTSLTFMNSNCICVLKLVKYGKIVNGSSVIKHDDHTLLGIIYFFDKSDITIENTTIDSCIFEKIDFANIDINNTDLIIERNDNMNGILLIDKPIDYTSRDVVNKLTKILKTKKVGHTGTLDPIATGVLVVCVGNTTKLCELLTSEYKEYIATIKLGLKTDTLDITGKILKSDNKKVKQFLN